MTRALRILLVANDGFSAGHVVRTLAIARGLARGAARRGIALSSVLATTSEADALLANEDLAIVRLPAPARAQRAGLADADRRRLVRAAIDATVDSFAPDLIVVDTFPNGPHGELTCIDRPCKRALVRRAVPDERVELLAARLDRYDRLILVDDAGFAGSGASIASTIVPPITLGSPPLSRDGARRALGLPLAGRVIAVAAGGGGDADGLTMARTIANTIATLEPETTVVIALGPLAPATSELTSPAIAPTGDIATSIANPRPDDFASASSTARRSTDDISTASMRPLVRPARDAAISFNAGEVGRSADQAPLAWTRDHAAPTQTPAVDSSGHAVPTRTLAIGSGATAAVRELRVAPLQPLLAAFDAVVSSAGYNTAHELAAARVPAILFPLPRPFDDQAGRALRLTAAGHAYLLAKHDAAELTRALAWARDARCPGLVTDGADRAADALFELVGARSAP